MMYKSRHFQGEIASVMSEVRVYMGYNSNMPIILYDVNEVITTTEYIALSMKGYKPLKRQTAVKML